MVTNLNQLVAKSLLIKVLTIARSRYHFAATLRTMKAFRIGRKAPGVWHNMTPPIRGGVYREPSISPCSLASVSIKEPESACSYTTSISDDRIGDSCDTLDHTYISRHRLPTPTPPSPPRAPVALNKLEDTYWQTDVEVSPPSPPNSDDESEDGHLESVNYKDHSETVSGGPTTKVPENYIDWAIRQGVEQDLEEYPSLDVEVQQKIVHRYRQLHEQIKSEGLYDCRFSEYAKEMIRYTTLFGLFIYTLQSGWYKTSAVFLGLFWVRADYCFVPIRGFL